MNTRTICCLALLGTASSPFAVHAQSATPGGAAGTPPAHYRLPPLNHMPQSAAAQNRELDHIGKKLLRETPNKPVATTASEGGGLEPPTH